MVTQNRNIHSFRACMRIILQLTSQRLRRKYLCVQKPTDKYLVGFLTAGVLGKCNAVIQVQVEALQRTMLHTQSLES